MESPILSAPARPVTEPHECRFHVLGARAARIGIYVRLCCSLCGLRTQVLRPGDEAWPVFTRRKIRRRVAA